MDSSREESISEPQRDGDTKVHSKRYIVGLGNPGSRYAATRHNVGFLAVDQFCRAFAFAPPSVDHQAIVRRRRWKETALEVVVMRPQTFMNRSGRAVRSLLSAELEEARLGGRPPVDLRSYLLVVHDDLDLPMGKLRFRGGGSAGGHRGIESVTDELGTNQLDRLKVGIGRDDAEAADYVLEPLEGSSREELLAVAGHAAAAIPDWIERGGAFCANRYNGRDGELYSDEE